jgi:hypothetical protein
MKFIYPPMKTEHATLAMQTAWLPPSKAGVLPPSINEGESKRFGSRTQVPIRVISPLVACSSSDKCLHLNYDRIKIYRLGEEVDLTVTYLQKEARKRKAPPKCWVQPALLVDNEEKYGSIYGEENEEKVARHLRLLRPNTSIVIRRLILPLLNENERDQDVQLLEVQPRKNFRGMRIVVECDHPMHVDVQSIFVANCVQAAGLGTISAALLTHENSPQTTWDTCTPEMRMRVGLINRMPEPVKVKVLIEGIQLAD